MAATKLCPPQHQTCRVSISAPRSRSPQHQQKDIKLSERNANFALSLFLILTISVIIIYACIRPVKQ